METSTSKGGPCSWLCHFQGLVAGRFKTVEKLTQKLTPEGRGKV